MEASKNKDITKSVKSFYVLKGIFSYLDENMQLKLFAHNKSLQKEYGFDLDYYKKVSGKYKILEKNGNGKEYDLKTKKLLFKGEYINGKKNG